MQKKISFLSLAIALASLLFFTSCQKESDNVKPSDKEISSKDGSGNSSATATSIEQEIFSLINQHRVSKGLPVLKTDSIVRREALGHSQNMANGTVPFGHTGFQDRVNRIRAAIGGNGFGENVAYGYTSAQSVVNGWLNSSGHKANIEGSYNLTGIGVAQNAQGRYYYTQIFVKKNGVVVTSN